MSFYYSYLLLLVLSHISPSFGITLPPDVVIEDLKADPPSDFTGWTVDSIASTDTFICGDLPSVFGRFGITNIVMKSYPTNSIHYRVDLKIDILKMNSWDDPDYVQLKETTTSTVIATIRKGDFKNQAHHCGPSPYGDGHSAYWDELKTFTFSINHSSATFDLELTSLFDEPNDGESWGLRNIQLTVINCPYRCGACTSPDKCTACLKFP